MLLISFSLSITNYHRFDGSDNKPLFLTVPESGKAETKEPVDQCLMRACFWFTDGSSSPVSSRDGEAEEASSSYSAFKGTNLIPGGSTIAT